MATISVANDQLVVRLHGIDPFLALRMSVEIPLEHVKDVRANPPEGDFDGATRDASLGMGVFIRGRIAVGSVALPDGFSFYDVRHKDRTIAIDLNHERYQHLVLELDDESPETAHKRLRHELDLFHARQAKKLGMRAG